MHNMAYCNDLAFAFKVLSVLVALWRALSKALVNLK